MPNKKGSKVAASKARAQTKAKKKARQGGPALAAAAYAPPPPAAEEGDGEIDEAAHTDASEPVAAAAPPAPASPARVLRGFRREHTHQTPPALSVSLRREVGFIGALTVVVAAMLVGLRFLTDLGG